MVSVYSKPRCQACESTKRKLQKLGIDFEELSLYDSPEILEAAKSKGIMAAPVVVAQGIMWGGYNERKLEDLVASDDDWDF